MCSGRLGLLLQHVCFRVEGGAADEGAMGPGCPAPSPVQDTCTIPQGTRLGLGQSCDGSAHLPGQGLRV